MKESKNISVKATVKSEITKLWNTWSRPKHLKKWNTQSPDWLTTKAENDLKEGGRFSSTMQAKDVSFAFDFAGTYNKVVPNQKIKYTLDDGRKVQITFKQVNDEIIIQEDFEPETQNTLKIQQQGWQTILDNFRAYVESN